MAKERQDTELTNDLRSLSGDILREVDQLGFIEAGFLFRAYLDDFTSGSFHLLHLLESVGKDQVSLLQTSTEVASVVPELKTTARRLCQLSRDILFAASPEYLSRGLRERVEDLFRITANLIPDTRDSELCDYKNYIGNRKLVVVETASMLGAGEDSRIPQQAK
jgi:hypothetical protein